MNHKTNFASIGARLLTGILIGTMILFGSARPAAGQGGVEVTEARVEYLFGTEINFHATLRVTSPIPIQSATVSFRPTDGIAQTRPLTLNPDGTAAYRYDARLNALPPFSFIVFWFDVTLTDGKTFTSSTYNFRYADNRFEWRELADGAARVHWYNGDAAFGASALDAARRGLGSAQNLVPFDPPGPIDVYVYANSADLQGALVLGGQGWVAGHASPELGVAMVSVAPGPEQGITLERQVPHELTHVLMYQRVGANYNRLPAWLKEGTATMAELYPNPDFAAALAQATQANSLLPLSDLCASFPPDSGGAFLAYAESESFTRYIVDNYGTTGLLALTSAYADGLDCEQGALQALGLPLSELEIRWRESALGENRGGVIASNLIPYLVLLVLLLIVPVWGSLGRVLGRRRNVGNGE